MWCSSLEKIWFSELPNNLIWFFEMDCLDLGHCKYIVSYCGLWWHKVICNLMLNIKSMKIVFTFSDIKYVGIEGKLFWISLTSDCYTEIGVILNKKAESWCVWFSKIVCSTYRCRHSKHNHLTFCFPSAFFSICCFLIATLAFRVSVRSKYLIVMKRASFRMIIAPCHVYRHFLSLKLCHLTK